MKKMILGAAALLLSLAGNAQVLTEWRVPETPSVNREYPVTGFMSYTSRESAAKNDYAASPYYKSLDGTWKYRRFSSVSEVIADIFTPEYNASGWEDAAIPWKGERYSAGKSLSEIPADVSADVFRTEFHVPFAWADKQVFIEVGEACSGVSVFVNGQQAGYAEDAKAPAVYDVTTLVKEGNNVLAIAAVDWSTGRWLDREQGRTLGRVCVKSLPKIRVRDFEITTGLSDNYRNGVLDFGVVVKSHLLNQKEVKVYFELFSPEGELLKSESKAVSLKMREEQIVHFDALIPDIQAWSAEMPSLYTTMTRIQYEGRYVEYIERKIGFRSVEMAEKEIRVNGKPVVFRGVNLTNIPDTEAETETLLRSLKAGQVNAVRPVSAPQPAYFYELCDRYGFYVLSEANIDSHAFGVAPETTLGNNPAYLNAHLDRVRAAYERTKNYASVILFSLGDRGGNGYNFYEAYLWMKSREKARPVLYAGAGREWNTDVVVDREDPARPTLTFNGAETAVQGGFGDDRMRYSSFVPIELRWTPDGKVEVANRTDFLTFDKIELRYEVDRAKGVIPCDLAPGQSGVYTLPKQGRRRWVGVVVREPFGLYQAGDVVREIRE